MGRKKTPTPANMPAVARVANELLDNIINHLCTHDILSLRATHRHFAPCCGNRLKDRMARLYIHPSRTSLLTVKAVCESGFGDKVREVVLLVGSMTQKVVKKAVPACTETFSPWPTAFPLTRDEKIRGADDEPLLKVLIKLLSSLSMLERLSLAEYASIGPGLNMTADTVVKSHTNKHTSICRATSSSNGSAQKKCSQSEAGRKLYTTDASVLLELFTSGLQLSSVSFGSELADLSPPVTNNIHWSEACGSLTSVELLVDRDRHCEPWQFLCNEMLREARMLQDLRIQYRPSAAASRQFGSRLIDNFILGSSTWPNLQNLEISGLPYRCPPSQGQHRRISFGHKLPVQSLRPSRPVGVGINLHSFVARHLSSLRTIGLSNVIFGEVAYEDEAHSPVGELRRLLTLLASSSSLERYAITINRFGHHINCTRPHEPEIHPSRFSCGIYDVGMTTDATLLEFEEAAETLQVELENGQWDFGAALKRLRTNGMGNSVTIGGGTRS